jgi:predicted ATPase
LGIPTTLQNALMARLDRLGPAKEIAQAGAVLGREFSYELLHAVSPVDEDTFQHGLRQLVAAELVYQSGLPPQARYQFKHALVQDTAYQSLLKSTRQKYHQQIAQVLEKQFSQTVETQPELVAHHYAEAGLAAQAIPYWQQAGQRATQRSANVEAISHLTKGLVLLKVLPDTPERNQQELSLQIALGGPLIAIEGYGVPEVGKVYARARELCQQVGETSHLFPMLEGLWVFSLNRGQLQMARELAEQHLSLAQRMNDPVHLLQSYYLLGLTLLYLGEFVSGREHLEQGVALYDPQQYRSLAVLSGVVDPGVICLCYVALVLWLLGYSEQALKRSQEAITLAQELTHSYSLAFALDQVAWLHQFRWEDQITQERAEALITLSTEQGFAQASAEGTIYRGWALAAQGKGEEGTTQMQQGLAALRATGTALGRPYWLALLAEVYGKVGKAEEGRSVLAEALAAVEKSDERWYEAELYRLRGELTLQEANQKAKGKRQKKFSVVSSQLSVPSPQPLTPSTQVEVDQEAEKCFLKAIEIAQRQQAKSLELRATVSLARLWQQQATQSESRNTNHASRAKLDEAHRMLSDIYTWFTEGFDTKDLQEAKALLDSLESSV